MGVRVRALPVSKRHAPHHHTHARTGGGPDEGSVMERLMKRLTQMKLLLYGDGEKEIDKEKSLVSA